MKGRGVAGRVSPRGSVAQWLDDLWGQNSPHSSRVVFSTYYLGTIAMHILWGGEEVWSWGWMSSSKRCGGSR